jgi:glycosyltransferase involved in cell wall biosynthesis
MPRIVAVAPEFVGTGAGQMAAAIIRHWLVADGWQVDVFRRSPTMAVPVALTDAGARVVDRIAPQDYALALVVGIGAVDMVRSIATKLAPRLPCLLWVHEGETSLWTSDLKVVDWLRLFRAFAAVVFQTAWQRDQVFASFLGRIPPARICVVPNGLPSFDEAAIRPARASPGRRRVVFVGGVYPRKRPEDLALAVEALRLPELECVFIGSTAHLATCAPRLRQLLQAHPERFRLLGELPRAETLDHVAGADMLCLPSASESQPLALLEAATLGVPICASDLPPYAGIWRHGHDCLLHRVGDTRTLAGHMLLALRSDPARVSLAQAARRTAQRFDFARFAEAFTRTAEAAMRVSRGR